MAATGFITASVFERAIAAAVRAPSMYNAQPWRFRSAGESIELRFDESRALPASDPDGWAARIALGAAAYNIQLALAEAGVASTLKAVPADGSVRVEVTATNQMVTSPRDRLLAEAIPKRFSHRGPFGPQPVPASARAHLVDAAVAGRAWIELVDDRVGVSRIAEILNCAEEQLRSDPAYTAEFDKWVGAEESAGEGITGAAAGVRPESQDLLPMRDFGGRARSAGRDFETDPLIAVLGTVGRQRYDDVAAGAALQRVLLTATADGLCSSMLSQAIEVPSARTDLGAALNHFGVAQMLIRIGYGEPLWPSPRRPIAEVIDW